MYKYSLVGPRGLELNQVTKTPQPRCGFHRIFPYYSPHIFFPFLGQPIFNTAAHKQNQFFDERKTLAKTRQSSFKQIKRSDGTICNTPEENAEVFQSHFQALFDREATYDESVLEELPQYPIHEHCDYRPTDEEIRAATRKLKNNAP